MALDAILERSFAPETASAKPHGEEGAVAGETVLDASYRNTFEMKWMIRRLEETGYRVTVAVFKRTVFETECEFQCLRVAPAVDRKTLESLQVAAFGGILFNSGVLA